MNAAQVKYAIKKAERLANKARLELSDLHRIQAISLTDDQKLKALRDGAFTTRDDSRYWWQRVYFLAERLASYTPDYEGKLIALEAAYSKLIDNIMLGSESEALALLAAFENTFRNVVRP